MRIIIDTIAELDELAEVWAAGRLAQSEQQHNAEAIADLQRRFDTARTARDARPVTAEGAVIPSEPQDDPQPASADAGEAPSTAPAEGKPKRKRRTKAEIAADEAAAKAAAKAAPGVTIVQANAAGDALEVTHVAPVPTATHVALVNNPPDPACTVVTGLNPDIVALAATIDGADKMAHMNEGRDFIAKHGFPKYNETFALADVPQHIATHTPEQAALHRAAMQWLAAQGGAA